MQQTADNIVELQNENIKAKITHKPGCQVRMEVDVTPEGVNAAFEKALKNVRKEVSVPGFRKGKVPETILHHNFAQAIEREARELLLQTAFTEALTLSKIQPFTRNSLKRSELKKCSKETGASALFELESEPQIPEIDYKNIEAKPIEARPLDSKAVDRSYRQLQLMHATWEPIEGQACKDGDYVELDIDVIEHPAHNVCVNHLFLVKKDEMPKWLYDSVVGMNVDESKEVDAKQSPEDPTHVISYEDTTTTKKSRVTLKAIKKAQMPEENDEFAQKFGAQTVDDLKKFVEERLKREEEEYAHELARYNLRREMLQKYPFDLPQSLVDAEVRGRLAFCKQSDMKKGALPNDPSKENDLKAQIEAETRGFFMWMFLMRQVTPHAEVSITQQELEQEFSQQMQLPRQQKLIYAGLAPDEVRNRLVMMIMMRKCEDYLLKNK
ncbi:MAG: trigger factor [Verrucomicrobia bacterium]|nr:trigger factor [Verrucomicrobiota bacterium]MBS0635894.1 trigger factor [Verrucomicrobiota bacterium]